MPDDWHDDFEDDIVPEKRKRDRRKFDTDKKADGPRFKRVGKSGKSQRRDLKQYLKGEY